MSFPKQIEAANAPISAPIRLLLIDDHPVVRIGLASLLGTDGHIEVIGAVGSGQAALDLLKNRPVDIALVDLRMPGLSGIEVIERICRLYPSIRSIVLSSFECNEEIYAAFKAGAKGYIHKEASGEEILNAIRAVHQGKEKFPRRIAERLASDRLSAGLSSRERQVLELVAKGLTNKEVANTLRISQFTVRNHLNHITEKLEVSDRTEAIFVAIQTGLIMIN